MRNLDMIIQVLFKRVHTQDVIEGYIHSNSFSKKELLRLIQLYVFHYSENEISNLLNYYIYNFNESFGLFTQRKLTELNVFDALFYCSFQYLLIKNNKVLCQYKKILEWRKLSLELGEDIFITAFLAAKAPFDEVKKSGFLWKRIIDHDNESLNVIMSKGYSENHFHLNGSAPIFHISWLSLMNNISSSKLMKNLKIYDQNRRNANVAYTSRYYEFSFSIRAQQAFLIRLLLFSWITDTPLKIGDYFERTEFIIEYIDSALISNNESTIGKGDLICYLKEKCLDEVKSYIQDKCFCYNNKIPKNKFCKTIHEIYDLDDIEKINKVLESCPDFITKDLMDNPNLINIESSLLTISINKIMIFLEKRLAKSDTTKSKTFFKSTFLNILNGKIGNTRISIRQLFYALDSCEKNKFNCADVFKLCISEFNQISLEDIRDIISDNDAYHVIWNRKTLNNVKDLLKKPSDLKRYVHYVQTVVDLLRMDNEYSYVDYAIIGAKKSGVHINTSDSIFTGERWLMYMMFRYIYHNEKESMEYINLFYAYLLIKENIRSEIIHSNNNVGFSNFQRYQARKGDLLADNLYRNHYVRMAFSDTMFVSNRMERLEIRFPPYISVEKNRSFIQQMDSLFDPENCKKDMFFYTLHFIKSPDIVDYTDSFLHCRNYSRRRKVGLQAKAIAQLREQYPHVGRRILGIDAASNEIGCRPEVFAVAYRYLREHRYTYITPSGIRKLPQLYTTYHVGEDFLDLSDGLRAIEEAILFLGMRSGDRLGHALALGIDVEEWYLSKNYTIAISKQDYLDNLMWVYHKLWEYDISGFINLREQIVSEFTKYFSEIYLVNFSEAEQICIDNLAQKEGIRRNKLYFSGESTIHNYYEAWKLRGDSPEFYRHGYFDEKEYIRKRNNFRINHDFPIDYHIRHNPEIAAIYYLYHYNKGVRIEGAKTIEVRINKHYIRALCQIQKELQNFIARQGIAIETNPSSNTLIGTFRDYAKHPIVKFFNKGLIHDGNQLKDNPQLQVSINTDDQGVFNTSLENEYALIACALEMLTDKDDKPLYNKYDIYNWIDKIRCMGNEQSFGYLSDMKEKGLYYDEPDK